MAEELNFQKLTKYSIFAKMAAIWPNVKENIHRISRFNLGKIHD